MSKPENVFKVGPVRASVFRNTFEKNGQIVPLPKVILEVRYKDKTGQWQGTHSLSLNDLPKAILALQKAFEYLTAQALSRIFLLMFTLVIVWIGSDLLFSFRVVGSYLDLFVVFFLGSLSLTSIGLVLAARGSSEEFTSGALNFIAWPIALIIMGKWLQNFPYRIGIGIEILLYSGLLALLIALLTLIIQVSRSARKNPVDSLNYE